MEYSLPLNLKPYNFKFLTSSKSSSKKHSLYRLNSIVKSGFSGYGKAIIIELDNLLALLSIMFLFHNHY